MAVVMGQTSCPRGGDPPITPRIGAAFYLKYRNRAKYESAGRLINEGL